MKKILFTTRFGLRKSVLDGRKTNTRRDERGLRKAIEKFEKTYSRPFEFMTQYFDPEWDRLVVRTPVGAVRIKTRFSLDEIVAVAQSYSELRFVVPVGADAAEYNRRFNECVDSAGWKNMMYVKGELMPHQIRITDVRVERLQDISDKDCLLEGITQLTFDTYSFPGWKYFCHDPREAFSVLIDKVSCKGVWDKNPYVVVYGFKLVK